MQVLLHFLNLFLAYGFLFNRHQFLLEDVGGLPYSESLIG